ncbi:MAG: Cna B-type domain-containing protein, partial [Tissierellia bacterium]|nr:Cna B-type domain-containing protein [Tissierellia bacterium]
LAEEESEEEPETINFKVKKNWNDNGKIKNGIKLRAYMLFTLYRKVGANEEEVNVDPIKIDGENTVAEWNNLPAKDEQGNEYEYFVKETADENPNIPALDSWKKDLYKNWKGSEIQNGVITNTLKDMEGEGTKIKITKILEPKPNIVQPRSLNEPLIFEFELEDPYGNVTKFNLRANETIEFEDVYYGRYELRETDPKGYGAFYNRVIYITSGEKEVDIEVRNTNDSFGEVPVPIEVKISIEKIWEGDKVEDIIIELRRKAYNADGKLVDELVKEFKFNFENSSGKKSITKDIDMLPKHNTDGYEYTYYVVEKNIPDGYASIKTDTTEIENNIYESVIIRQDFKVINRPIEYNDYPVEKIWQGGPMPDIVLELWRKIVDGEELVLDEKVDECKITKDKLIHIFKGLPNIDENGREYVYYAKEVNIPEGYTQSVSEDGLTITNTFDEDDNPPPINPPGEDIPDNPPPVNPPKVVIPEKPITQTDNPPKDIPDLSGPEEVQTNTQKDTPEKPIPPMGIPKTGYTSYNMLYGLISIVSLGGLFYVNRFKKDE